MQEYTALMHLQEIDLEMFRYTNRLDHLPQRSKLDACTKAARKLKKECTTLVGHAKDAASALADNAAAHAATMEKIEQVKEQTKLHKSDYRALEDDQAQLVHLAKRKEKLSFDRKGLKAHQQTCTKALENAQKLAQTLAAQAQDLTRSYKQDKRAIKQALDVLEKKRVELVREISDEHMRAYNDAAARFQGLAVEELVGNIPTVCRIKLQPSLYNQIRNTNGIACCPYCHRILILPSDADAPTTDK